MANKIIKVWHVFEKYPLFYQPYIPPVLDELSKSSQLSNKIIAYKGKKTSEKDVSIYPSHRSRIVFEKLHQFKNKSYKNLNYLSIKALKADVDIIHIQHSFFFPKILPLLQIPKTDRPKIVITLRGGDTYIKPWIFKKWKDFFSNYGDKVDCFITMSEDQKKYLMRWGVPKENISVIPISFGSSFSIQPKSIKGSKLKFVSVFRLCWEKNIDGNLRFIKHLKENGIDVEYDIYGDGPDEGKLLFLIDKYNLSDYVFYKNKISNDALKEKLLNYHFILQLSLSESLGMSVIEAQSLGLPAIVSNNGGLPEIIADGVNGIVISDSDYKLAVQRLKILILDKDIYIKMSLASIEISHSRYSVEQEVESLEQLYSVLST